MDLQLIPSGKVVRVLGEIKKAQGPRFPNRLADGNGGFPLFPKKSRLKSRTLAKLQSVLSNGRYLEELDNLHPTTYDINKINLGVNDFSAGASLPVEGCIALSPYTDIREAAKEAIGISRFGDRERADEFFINDPNWSIVDSYIDSVLGALMVSGIVLKNYSRELIESRDERAEWNAALFLKACGEKIYPVLNPRKHWDTGLEFINSLADGLDELSSSPNLSKITEKVRAEMKYGGDQHFISRQTKYPNENDEEMLARANVTPLH